MSEQDQAAIKQLQDTVQDLNTVNQQQLGEINGLRFQNAGLTRQNNEAQQRIAELEAQVAELTQL